MPAVLGTGCDVEELEHRRVGEAERQKVEDQNEHYSACTQYYAVIAACGVSGLMAGLWDGCTKTPLYGAGKGLVTTFACLSAAGIASTGEFFELADECGRSLVPAYDTCEEPISGYESAGCHEDPFLSCREIMDCRSINVKVPQVGHRQRRCDEWPADQDPRCTDGYIQCLKNTYEICNEPDVADGASCEIPSGDYDLSYDVTQADLDLVLLGWGSDARPDTWINEAPIGIVDQRELDAVLQNWGSASTPPPTGDCSELAAMCPGGQEGLPCLDGDEDACIAEDCQDIGLAGEEEACAEFFGACAGVCT